MKLSSMLEATPFFRALVGACVLAACSANGASSAPPGDDTGGASYGGASGSPAGGSAGTNAAGTNAAGNASAGTSGQTGAGGIGAGGVGAGGIGAGGVSGDTSLGGAGAGNAGLGGVAGSLSGAGGSTAGAAGSSAGKGGSGGGAAGSGAGTGGSAAGMGGTSAGGTSAGGTSAGGSSAGTGGSSAGAGGTGGGGGNFPANNATGVCLDAPLTLTFTSAPTVGAAGTISIFDSSAPNTAIDTVNVGAGTYTDTIGGQAFNVVRPVFIDGNQAVVYFHQHKLKANTKYFVTVSSGTFLNGQTPVGTVGPNTWSFTTGPAPTAAAAMTVDRTGSGPFCTVQGAFDAIANNNTTARTITVQPGNYHEIVYVAGGKKNITLQGADRAASLIEYPNNNNLNASTSTRNVFYANGTTGMTLSNLTIYNTTPQDGSQAEALRVQADQVILRNANFKSLQDTLDLSGRVYVVGSYIEGNVDFVWGSGAAYFDQCELKTVGRSGAVVQARNGQTAYGYAFVDSKLTAGSGVSNQVLGRIDASQFPYSHVAYINCQMTAIAAKGWTITNPQSPSNLRFWEYQSTDANGKALDTSQRVVQQIDAATAAMMRDKTVVLAGWNPT